MLEVFLELSHHSGYLEAAKVSFSYDINCCCFDIRHLDRFNIHNKKIHSFYGGLGCQFTTLGQIQGTVEVCVWS